MSIATYPPKDLVPSSTTLGYAEIQANQASITTEVDVTGLSVTVFIPAGRRIKVSALALPGSTVGDDQIEGRLYEDGVRRASAVGAVNYAGNTTTIAPVWIGTPTAGMHTYKLTMQRAAGTGSVTIYAGAGYPAHILVEDITGSTSGPGPIQLGYAEVTATQGSITTEVDLTGLAVTVTVPEGRRIKITGHGWFNSSVVGDEVYFTLKEGSTEIQMLGLTTVETAARSYTLDGSVVITPTAGVHTYKLRAARSVGSGNVSLLAQAGRPAFILVEDITGTPAPGGILPTSQTLAYALNAANTTGITTTETFIPALAATFTVPSGRRIKITTSAYPQSTVAGDNIILAFYDNGVRIDENRMSLSVANGPDRMIHTYVYTPTAGTHIITVSMWRLSGSGTITNNAGGTWTGFTLIEDITGGAPAYPAVNVPVGRLAYAEKVESAPVAIPSGLYDIPGLSANVVVPEGRTLKITTFLCMGGGATNECRIYRGGTQLNRSHFSSTAPGISSHTFTVFDSPAAGSHTYKVSTANASAGTLYCDTPNEAYIMVEDVTPTPAPANTAPSSTLGYAEVVAAQASISSEVDLTGLTVTVTVAAGRRLKITGKCRIDNDATAGNVIIRIKEGTTELARIFEDNVTGTDYQTAYGSVIISPSAGTHTYKLTGNKGTGAGTFGMNAWSTNPAWLLVEDITGSGISGHTHTELDDTGWITPTLINSWVNYGGGWTGARYRKKAGIVYLQGLIKSGTSGWTAFVLPTGFRPHATDITMFTSVSGEPWAVTRIDINGSNGNVVVTRPSDTWVTLSCSFPADA